MIFEKFNKKRTAYIAVMLASCIALGCTAVCIIAAAPNESKNIGGMLNSIEPLRIVAPADELSVSIIDPVVKRASSTTGTTNNTDANSNESIKGSDVVSPAKDTVVKTETSINASAPETSVQTNVPNIITDSKTDVFENTTAENDTSQNLATTTTTTTEITEAPDDTGIETDAAETEIPEAEVFNNTMNSDTSDEEFFVEPELKSYLLADDLGIKYTTSKLKYTPTEEEIQLVATFIQIEVMGTSTRLYGYKDVSGKYWEMLAVGQVIRNRRESKTFPNTYKEVVLQKYTRQNGKVIYQFSPAKYIDKYTPTYEAIVAAKEVLCSGVTVLPSNYLYFCATGIEKSFEKANDYVLLKKANGSYDKMYGHLSTFYASK